MSASVRLTCLPQITLSDTLQTASPESGMRAKITPTVILVWQALFYIESRKKRREKVLPSDNFRARPSLVEADSYSKTWMLTWLWDKTVCMNTHHNPQLGSGSWYRPAIAP